MGEPLTPGGQFALRSELWGLMRISRIARPGALYGASVSAQTSDEADETNINPIDFEEMVDLNLSQPTGNIQHNHIEGFDKFMGKYSNGGLELS